MELIRAVPIRAGIVAVSWLILLAGSTARLSQAQSSTAAALDGGGPNLEIRAKTGAITLDGELGDPGWSGVKPIDTWWETNISQNGPPPVKTVGYLTFDEKFLYVAIECFDPDMKAVRGPLGDRDSGFGNADFAGIIVDADNDGRTGVLFLVNSHGIQYDATNDDTSGNEDSSPNFFWDSAVKRGSQSWVIEMRIPFSQLRYRPGSEQTWRAMLYRNYPHGRRYQMFTTKLPQGGNCFVCWSNLLTGLHDLPTGQHLVIAPYLSGSRTDQVSDGDPNGDLQHGPLKGDDGADIKWTPNGNTAVDLAINPDFSQVESDVPQITANERFALFFPERRPFFLESVDLFSTPIQAVYTRTIGSPRWGGRVTGRFGNTIYTALVAQDRGRGLVLIPGTDFSEFTLAPSSSIASVVRARHDVGASFFGFLATSREYDEGAYNRVVGPDFQWRPNDLDAFGGQLLYSRSENPDRPDLASSWSGQTIDGHALLLSWAHSSPNNDIFLRGRDLSRGFRADNGFEPQVGFRDLFMDAGHTWRPQDRFISRLRLWLQLENSEDLEREPLSRAVRFGVGMDGRYDSFLRVWLDLSRDRAGSGPESGTLPRRRFQFIANIAPSRVVSHLELRGVIGDEIDFSLARRARGGTLTFTAILFPSEHLQTQFLASRRWLDTDQDGVDGGAYRRSLVSTIERLRLQYSFNANMFLRLIGEYSQDERPWIDVKQSQFSGSLLFSYKLNWQTVMFLGYGDERLSAAYEDPLHPVARSFFAKLSYAFQR